LILSLSLLLSSGCLPENYLYGYWTEPPLIEVCDNIKLDWVVDQFDWWGEISDSYYYYDVTYSECTGSVPDYSIWIHYAPDLEYSGQAKPNKVAANYPYIISGEIWLAPHANSGTLLHEIGHAWGWDHWPDGTDHVMATNRTGNETYGLEDYPGL
jgi:hypothetical protein